MKVSSYIVYNMYEYFNSTLVAQKIILGNTVNPPIDSNSIHKLGNVIQ